MAGAGGRNVAVSWIVGVLCAVVVGVLVWCAIPLLSIAADTVGSLFGAGSP